MKATKTTNWTPLERQRIDDVRSLLLDGAELWDVVHFVDEKRAANEPPWTEAVDEPALRSYVAAAERQIAASGAGTEAKHLKRHLAQRRNIYAKAVLQNDLRTALSALRDEANLLGLYQRRERKRPPKIAALGPAATTDEVQTFLANTMTQLLRGELDPKTVQSALALAAVQMKVQGERADAEADRLALELTAEAEPLPVDAKGGAGELPHDEEE